MYLNVKVASISPCEELAGLRVKALTKDMYNAGLLRCAWDRQDPWVYLHHTESLHYLLMASGSIRHCVTMPALVSLNGPSEDTLLFLGQNHQFSAKWFTGQLKAGCTKSKGHHAQDLKNTVYPTRFSMLLCKEAHWYTSQR